MAEKTKAGLLETGVCAVLTGALLGALFPAYAPYGLAIALTGGLGVVSHYKAWSELDVLFRNLKLGKGESYPLLKRKTRKDGYMLYEYTLPRGMTVKDYQDKADAIRQAVGNPVLIEYGFKNLLIRVYDRERKEKYDYEVTAGRGRLEIPIGYDLTGKLITTDLSSGEPHLLIAGETGSGKSTVLRSIITDLILTKNVDLYLIDLKRGAELNIFRRVDRVQSFARTRAEAESLLRALGAEVDRRYDLFFDNDVVDIKQYNRKFPPLRYQVLIIDEFADLMNERDSTRLIEELSAKARACGVHLLISTQRPDMRVLNGRIKANVSSVLGLKTMNDINSRIIIGHDGLEQLRGAGHGIFKRGAETDVQCPFLSVERAQALIAPHIVAKNQPAAPEQIVSLDFMEVFSAHDYKKR